MKNEQKKRLKKREAAVAKLYCELRQKYPFWKEAALRAELAERLFLSDETLRRIIKGCRTQALIA